MKHAVLDAEGTPLGFYDSAIHGAGIPPEAVEISDDEWQELLDHPGRRRLINGAVVPHEPPPRVPTQGDYRRAIQGHVDSAAQARQYDTGASCASYAASTIPAWSAEAQAFIAWRDGVWAYAYAEMAKVEAGHRSQPSIEEFLAELPAIAWPG